jgi:regulator of replication initiation timing
MTVEKRLFERLHELKIHIKSILQENTFMTVDLKKKQEQIDKLIMDIENKNNLINELRIRIDCLIKENKKINGSFKKY